MKILTLNRKNRRIISSVCNFILAAVLSLILIIPFAWMVLCSFQLRSADIFMNPPVFPSALTFKNFADAISSIDMINGTLNTLTIVGCNMVFGIVSSVMVAYAFARSRVRYKNIFFAILMATMMLPWVVTLVPSYIIYYKLGWLNPDMFKGYLPLIAPSIGGNAFFIFLFRQFLMGIPRALDEAAEIDGCGKMGILFRILLPQCVPILVTMIIFSFNTGWSDYVGPSIYITKSENYTLSIALSTFVVSNSSTPWNTVMAGCLIFSLPMIVVMFSAQNAFQRGIVSSGIKG